MTSFALVKPEDKEAEIMDLVVGGERIGRVIFDKLTDSCRFRYHVVVDGTEAEGLSLLHQGHGDTLEAAIAEMLDRGERYAAAQLGRLRELRGLLQP